MAASAGRYMGASIHGDRLGPRQAGLPVEVMHIVAVHSKEGDGGHRSLEANIIFHCDFANFEPFKD